MMTIMVVMIDGSLDSWVGFKMRGDSLIRGERNRESAIGNNKFWGEKKQVGLACIRLLTIYLKPTKNAA